MCFKSELLVRQKEKSRTCCNFEIFDSDPQLDIKFETWNKILKPIRILVKILIVCIGTCIPYLCIYKYTYTWSIYPQSIKKIEGHFLYPVHPPQPTRKHVPAVNLRFLITTRLFSIFRKKGLSPTGEKKSELLGQKMKNHLPAVILKIFITTPNLTSNFETHKNVGDNFVVYIYI